MFITTKPYLRNNLQHFDWRPSETLQRDKEQSHLLHEPKFRIMTTDPISGHDVDDYMSHCSLLDGNLTIYFLLINRYSQGARLRLDSVFWEG